MDHKVQVWSRQYDVAVYQRSKTVWIASGNYEGQQIETKGRTETQALAAWREAARYRGN